MEQHSIISIYATLKAYLAKIPEYDKEYRKGFEDALLLTFEGMKLCPSVNHALEIRRLERSLESASIMIQDLQGKINRSSAHVKIIERVLRKKNKEIEILEQELETERSKNDNRS